MIICIKIFGRIKEVLYIRKVLVEELNSFSVN
jgi:hypothetical protein